MNDGDQILVIDVGNSTTVLALMDLRSRRWQARVRLTSNRDRTVDEWRALVDTTFVEPRLPERSLAGVCISSVVPAVTRSLVRLCSDWLGETPLVVSHDLDLGFTVATDQPWEVGSDRIVNAAAAIEDSGCPVIIVDAGTATKIDAVSADNRYLGGVIAPGMGISLDALAGRAARLYAVELSVPPRVIGTNTIDAIRSGVVIGHLAMVEGLIAREREQLDVEAPVIVTGGFGGILAPHLSLKARFIPDLTLSGIALVWERNAGSKARYPTPSVS
jgi:type III pantothenate kinase